MAALHRAAFDHARPWSVTEFQELIGDPTTRLLGDTRAFALIRTVLDEGEVLTLATHPDHHRKGLARALLQRWFDAPGPARHAFLEVASDNTAALALYHSVGFAEAGLRKGYYRRPDGARADAIVMRRALTSR